MQKEEYEEVEKLIEIDLKDKTESELKAEFLEEYHNLVAKYGFDFLQKLNPPEIVRVNIIKNVDNNTREDNR